MSGGLHLEAICPLVVSQALAGSKSLRKQLAAHARELAGTEA